MLSLHYTACFMGHWFCTAIVKLVCGPNLPDTVLDMVWKWYGTVKKWSPQTVWATLMERLSCIQNQSKVQWWAISYSHNTMHCFGCLHKRWSQQVSMCWSQSLCIHEGSIMGETDTMGFMHQPILLGCLSPLILHPVDFFLIPRISTFVSYNHSPSPSRTVSRSMVVENLS